MAEQSQLTELFKRSFHEFMKDVATSIPGHVLAFDPHTQLAQIQIGIVKIDVHGKTFTPPPLIQVPVYFPGGSFCLEFQVDPKDEGFILFSQRCIDAWSNTGGVANNPILRFHDFSDACFFPGIRSQPNKIVDFQNNGIRIRNKAGDKYVWLKKDGTIAIKGDISHDGKLTSSGDIVGAGISLSTHAHTNGTNAQGNTGTPIP